MRCWTHEAVRFTRLLGWMPIALAIRASTARAQELEPRAYSAAPVGMNFLVAGYAYAQGGVTLDPAVPLTDAELHLHVAMLAYARTLDLWGLSGKFDVALPYAWLYGRALVMDELRTREVSGFGDPRLRFGFNFIGAPALSAQEFAGHRPSLIVGTTLAVTAPLGQYDSSYLVNIGSHRWSFEPELGISKTWGSWGLELTGSVTFYTTNQDYWNGGKSAQAPISALQAHVVYVFAPALWAALDAVYYGGGRTTINGVKRDTRQSNTRLGATFALPISRHQSIKLYLSTGVSTLTGSDFNALGAAWQYRFGGDP
jgi:hypothetical protein